ncbi:predicted protein [Plenodomus lingam JN3]|uniref:Predicted protein n=1 Tax=Leptosphaeria maculans (strain JN3 / isolate v23.1.3 / race Av1-4-5-6-7-8) TaxID=985895 RepID=E4ZTP1_LEPMJ|nr:predicted protein [Plenodomus lingam JN3]CBX94897.1 predicted protein [Plenodomus lingam JN3]
MQMPFAILDSYQHEFPQYLRIRTPGCLKQVRMQILHRHAHASQPPAGLPAI